MESCKYDFYEMSQVCLSTVPVELCAALSGACSVPAQILCRACEVSLAWICIRSIMWCCRASSKTCDLDTSGCALGGEISAVAVSEETQPDVSLPISLLFPLSGELNSVHTMVQ